MFYQVIQRRPMIASIPSLSNLDDALPERAIAAMRAVSAGLRALGVRHLLLGGMAVGVYGYPRNTKDVDILIGPEGCVRGDAGELYPSPAVLALADAQAIPVDMLVLRDPAPLLDPVFLDEMDDALEYPLLLEGIPIAPLEIVVATKLLRQKARDVADIVELAQRPTFDVEVVRRFVNKVLRPPLPADFERHLAQAEREREG